MISPSPTLPGEGPLQRVTPLGPRGSSSHSQGTCSLTGVAPELLVFGAHLFRVFPDASPLLLLSLYPTFFFSVPTARICASACSSPSQRVRSEPTQAACLSCSALCSWRLRRPGSHEALSDILVSAVLAGPRLLPCHQEQEVSAICKLPGAWVPAFRV